MCRVTEIQAGNEQVFRDVFNEYQSLLYQFLVRKLHSEFYAKEVVQLSFIKLWRFRHQLDADLDISVQLFRIARTTLIDEIRKIQTRQRHYASLAPAERPAAEEALQKLYYKDTNARLARLVQLLPPQRRAIFELSRFHYHSNSEIAKMLSISPKTVENHLTIALRAMRSGIALFWIICPLAVQLMG
ncbi:MAG: RNA polymerase sigma-70 factor [Candidatus Pseudobacter hemicellulosilyticus]|uniref:RNA polymerase sigma-70 factor n=1 Tax=Candidatus Pseudobacter hemicellulosilyticus TaxID=3121375 RepID=A0AAJ6BGB2_9BACT|nr:MAG: RNA polymerase sigma-70 factor [Pseudobacter sp.]